jgi:hypothetical protein
MFTRKEELAIKVMSLMFSYKNQEYKASSGRLFPTWWSSEQNWIEKNYLNE